MVEMSSVDNILVGKSRSDNLRDVGIGGRIILY